MKPLPLRGTMICWEPMLDMRRSLPLVQCGPHPAYGWDRHYQCSDGACYADWQTASDAERLRRLLVLFVLMTIREGIPVAEVHRAFLAIDEYREAMPPDAREHEP